MGIRRETFNLILDSMQQENSTGVRGKHNMYVGKDRMLLFQLGEGVRIGVWFLFF